MRREGASLPPSRAACADGGLLHVGEDGAWTCHLAPTWGVRNGLRPPFT
jgi:hypothetical protein